MFLLGRTMGHQSNLWSSAHFSQEFHPYPSIGLGDQLGEVVG